MSRAAFRRVPNPTLQWHGISAPGLTQRLLLRIGDCSWQYIPYGHTWGAPGYPRLVAEALLERDIGLSFANYHCGVAHDLPDRDALDAACDGRRPDAIIIQIGGYYASRGIVRTTLFEPYELRTWFNWLAGPVGGLLHRAVARPLVRRWGYFRAEAASDLGAGAELTAFVVRVRDELDSVPVGLIAPHMTTVDGALNPARLADAANVLVPAARAAAADVIDVRPDLAAAPVRSSRLFSANGWDLRWPGQEIVAGRIVRWLEGVWDLSTAREAETNARSLPLRQ